MSQELSSFGQQRFKKKQVKPESMLNAMHSSKLDQKIYQPHFISNMTIIEFQGSCQEGLYSVMDIFKIFVNMKKSQSKLYFKVFKLDSWAASLKSDKKESKEQGATCQLTYKTKKRQSGDIRALSSTNETGTVKYYEFEFRKVRIDEKEGDDMEQSGELSTADDQFIMFTMKDISSIIKN